MVAKCEVCGKGIVFGKQYSHSHIRTNRKWKPNTQRVRVMLGGKPQKINVCTRCLRSGKVQRAN
ncbi:MAG: 50S ribosomal protein L28 [Syntrophomonadaceae bacterium]|nr:50S ribosomal protein L28 [Syntrophomonadaceae bacterium]